MFDLRRSSLRPELVRDNMPVNIQSIVVNLWFIFRSLTLGFEYIQHLLRKIFRMYRFEATVTIDKQDLFSTIHADITEKT